jgi:hypothetical protein
MKPHKPLRAGCLRIPISPPVAYKIRPLFPFAQSRPSGARQALQQRAFAFSATLINVGRTSPNGVSFRCPKAK